MSAETTRFTIHLRPLECVEESIHNGVSTETFITPDECKGLPHHHNIDPHDQLSGGNNSHVESQNQSDILTPNTGAVRYFLDGVTKNADLLLATGISVAGIILAARVKRHR